MVLILVELLFAIPISNAKVERLFSLMNRVKPETRATLSESTLNNLVTIWAEGPELQDYDPTPAHLIMAIKCSPPTKSENTEEVQKPRCCKKVAGFN